MNATFKHRGLTLIEMVVTVSLVSILAASATAFMFPAFKSYLAVEQRAAATEPLDAAMKLMMSELRSADEASVSATASGVSFQIGGNSIVYACNAGGLSRTTNSSTSIMLTNIKYCQFTYSLVGAHSAMVSVHVTVESSVADAATDLSLWSSAMLPT